MSRVRVRGRECGIGGTASTTPWGHLCVAGTADVGTVEKQLRDGYLQPLEDGGLTFEVVEVCHYSREEDEPWHLGVSLAVDASPERVAEVLSQTVGVLLTDRDPMVVQQYEGEPAKGWDGAIADGGDTTTVGLVKNNVVVEADQLSVGWLQECELPL